MPSRETHILISGGGTGGHIFPALAIANKLRERIPGVEILFVGAKGKMEMIRVPEAGYPIKGLWISGIRRDFSFDNLLFPAKLACSLLDSFRIMRSFKPDVAIGVGGFASGPALKMAGWMGVPTLIQEQNSYPGITNKWLSASVNRICVAYPGMERYFPAEKVIITGNPVRKEVITTTGKRDEAASLFNMSKSMKTLLVIGGSQGALSINRAVSNSLGVLKELGIQLIWQTGASFIREAEKSIGTSGCDHFRAIDFIQRMDLAYAMGDIVVSRAGAISIAELANVRKPVIFIPFPSAAEDHQTKNAQELVSRNAAVLIRDREATVKLPSVLKELANDDALRKTLEENIGHFAIADADSRIADEVIKLMGLDR